MDVNHSRRDCTSEGSGTRLRPVRLGLCLVAGLAEKDSGRLVGTGIAAYGSIDDLQRRTRL